MAVSNQPSAVSHGATKLTADGLQLMNLINLLFHFE